MHGQIQSFPFYTYILLIKDQKKPQIIHVFVFADSIMLEPYSTK